MKIVFQAAVDSHFDLLVLPFWAGTLEAADLSAWKGVLAQALKSGDFKGKPSESLLLYGEGRILLLGLGKKEAVTAEVLRRAYSSAVRIAQSKKAKTMHIVFPQTELARAVAEGIFLTNYAFDRLKHDNLTVLLDQVVFVGVKASDEKQFAKWQTIVSGVNFARDLINGNADDVTPKMLADTALSLQAKELKAQILDKKQIEQEKMGLLLAVSRGSAVDPYLITLSYHGNPKSKEHIVLVGKGITYDTGGLDLKPPESMLTMKRDMAGAATILAAVQTAALLGLKVNVTAVAPVAENAIDAKSYKMGDVYSSMSGKTVEVTNTDAEGRLILADAITYAKTHLHPTLLVDIASLTGGIVVALGDDVAGFFTNDDHLAQNLNQAANATDENLWRMPLYADYKEMLKSEIADLVNSAGRSASSMTGALFLQEFVGSVPWAHIDFAGPCYLSKPKFYHTSKATGFGVRLLIDFLERAAS